MNYDTGSLWLSPAEVKFTQDSVAMCFQNNRELNKTCEDIVNGISFVRKFPTIRVVTISNGTYYSHDNRRLYVFRVLNMLGLLPKIEVTESNRIDTSKITTINGGCHVFVRNRKDNNGRWRKAETFRHCTCEQGKRNYRLPDWWNENQQCHISQVQVRVSIQSPFHPQKEARNASQHYFGEKEFRYPGKAISAKPNQAKVTAAVPNQSRVTAAKPNQAKVTSAKSSQVKVSLPKTKQVQTYKFPALEAGSSSSSGSFCSTSAVVGSSRSGSVRSTAALVGKPKSKSYARSAPTHQQPQPYLQGQTQNTSAEDEYSNRPTWGFKSLFCCCFG